MILASSSFLFDTFFHSFSEKRKDCIFNFEKMKFSFEQANTQLAKLHSILEWTLNQKFILDIIHTISLYNFEGLNCLCCNIIKISSILLQKNKLSHTCFHSLRYSDICIFPPISTTYIGRMSQLFFLNKRKICLCPSARSKGVWPLLF